LHTLSGIALATYDCFVVTNGDGVSIDFEDVPAGLFPREQAVCQIEEW